MNVESKHGIKVHISKLISNYIAQFKKRKIKSMFSFFLG